jgi:hypothetical protein
MHKVLDLVHTGNSELDADRDRRSTRDLYGRY